MKKMRIVAVIIALAIGMEPIHVLATEKTIETESVGGDEQLDGEITDSESETEQPLEEEGGESLEEELEENLNGEVLEEVPGNESIENESTENELMEEVAPENEEVQDEVSDEVKTETVEPTVEIEESEQPGKERKLKLTYSAHVQKVGWQNPVNEEEVAGTQNQSLRMEALKIFLKDETTGESLNE